METRIIDGVYVNADVDFCEYWVLAMLCTNGEPAFRVEDLGRRFKSEIPADIREKHTLMYTCECEGEANVEEFVTLDGAVLWASRIPDGFKWVDHMQGKVASEAKRKHESLLACRQRHLDDVTQASAKIARFERKLRVWEDREELALKRFIDLDTQLRVS